MKKLLVKKLIYTVGSAHEKFDVWIKVFKAEIFEWGRKNAIPNSNSRY